MPKKLTSYLTPKEKPVPLMVRLPQEVHAEIVRVAERLGVSLNEALTAAARMFVDQSRRR